MVGSILTLHALNVKFTLINAAKSNKKENLYCCGSIEKFSSVM